MGTPRPRTRDHILQEECERFELTCLDAVDFVDSAKELLDLIVGTGE